MQIASDFTKSDYLESKEIDFTSENTWITWITFLKARTDGKITSWEIFNFQEFSVGPNVCDKIL